MNNKSIRGNICYRCGKFYSNSKIPKYSIAAHSIGLNYIDLDLCPSCCEDLKWWLEDERNDWMVEDDD